MRLSDISWRTVLIGTVIALAVFLGIRFVFNPLINREVRSLITLAGIPLGALAGGFYAARQSGYYPVLHSLIISLIEVVVLFIGGSMPEGLLIPGLTLLAGLLGTLLADRTPTSAYGTPFMPRGGYSPGGYTYSRRTGPFSQIRIRNPFAKWMSEMRARRLYQNLLRRSRFNPDLADRLIDFERRRTPNANRETLIRNALERLERDNR